MTTSRTIAGIAGPTLVAIGMTEAINLRALDEAQAPVGLVYLNGGLLFAAGVAILRVHNRWSWRWPVLVTLTGWSALLTGLLRMVAPGRTTSGGAWVYGLLAVMLVTGVVLTLKAYGPLAEEDDGAGAAGADNS